MRRTPIWSFGPNETNTPPSDPRLTRNVMARERIIIHAQKQGLSIQRNTQRVIARLEGLTEVKTRGFLPVVHRW